MTVTHERNHPPIDAPCSELLWEAVRYLSGELSAAEAAAYEDRLADDVAAAEALARAVVLGQSVTAPPADLEVLAQPALAAAIGRTRRAWGGVAATATAAVLCLALGWLGRGAVNRGGMAGADPNASATGASSVGGGSPSTRVQSQIADPVLAAWVSLADRSERSWDDLAADLVAEPSVDADAGVPGWMFAALRTSSFPAAADGAPPPLDDEWEDL